MRPHLVKEFVGEAGAIFRPRGRNMKHTKADVIEVQKTLNGVGPGIRIGF